MSASSTALSCGTNLTDSPSINRTLSKFANVAGDACVYGCYLSILYENAIQKYADINSDITSIGTSITSFLSRAVLDPSLLGGADEALVAQLQELVNIHLTALQDITSTTAASFSQASF